MRAEYDIRGGVRGKYYERYRQGINIVASARGEVGKHRAFVIMPFGEGFDEIYNLFIAGAIAEAGYDVYRADDILSHQNILKDIVMAIFDSDLVIADLTGANPNVYYELGLAHAFQKRVVLLTQQVDDLPFDLRSYRVIPYSTHFAEIAKARAQLVSLARDALSASIPFGSPVTDFLPHEAVGGPRSRADNVGDPSLTPDAESGLLDHLVSLEEGFKELTGIVEAVGEETVSVGKATVEITQRLQELVQAGSPAKDRRTVVITLAQRLSDYADSLSRNNDLYAKTLTVTRTSLEFLIRSQQPSNEEERQQLRAFLVQMDAAESNIQGARAAVGKLAETIRATPRVERAFNRAADHAVREFERYAQNLDQTISMVVRARDLTRARLND